VRFAATEKRRYLNELGLRVLPLVGWAERGDGRAIGHGNSVPRFHLTWGTGPEVVRVFRDPVLNNARQFRGDRLVRVAKPHKLLDPEHGPLIAVRLNILTRKTVGGLETNLDAQVLRPDGSRFRGLYAAGELAGFGGGGVHGYNALEGTFLGGCIFSGRAAGLALARELAGSAPATAVAGGAA
jgi:predicted oxidoreductase